MRIGVIRFNETPAVAVFVEDQLVFSERLEYSEDIMQMLFDKLNGFDLDELKIIFKSTITNTVPKNGVKLSSFKIGNIMKYSCCSADDFNNLNALASALSIDTITGYDYISYYKSRSMNRDVIIVDRDISDQYICVYCSNGNIKDYRLTRYRNLEKTLTHMMNTYQTTDVLHIPNSYDLVAINGSIKNNVTEQNERCFVDTLAFAFSEEPVKDLSSREDASARGFLVNEESSQSDVGNGIHDLSQPNGKHADTTDIDDEIDDNEDDEEVSEVIPRKSPFFKGNKQPREKKIKQPKQPKIKKTKSKEDTGNWDYGKSSTSEANFIMNSSHSSDSKKNKIFSGVLNFVVSLLFLCMVGGVVVTTIYKDRFNSMSDQLIEVEKDIAELEPTNQALQNVVDGKDNLEAINAISELGVDGVVEEVRYNKKNLEVTVAFKSTESLETYKSSLQSLIGVKETASVGTVNYEGEKYDRYTFKCPPYLGM